MPPFTTEFTQAQVDAISRAMARGVLEVEHHGLRTRFQSLAAMRELRDLMKSEIAAAEAASVPPARVPYMTRRTVFVRD